VLCHVELQNLVLETDAPYLPPVPKRGRRNESSYLIYIAQKISEIFETPVEKVADITSANARNLFGF
ncbi:MAG: hydrolase TatD, partial [Bacteroidia bacterium]|nr:hydrolase TatD [Bacteroidia bacterium]